MNLLIDIIVGLAAGLTATRIYLHFMTKRLQREADEHTRLFTIRLKDAMKKEREIGYTAGARELADSFNNNKLKMKLSHRMPGQFGINPATGNAQWWDDMADELMKNVPAANEREAGLSASPDSKE